MRISCRRRPGQAHESYRVRTIIDGARFGTYPRLDSGQWTPQAKDLYDLIILTFSNDANGLADLAKLQTAAALSSTEWEDLLQYTSQVCNFTLSRFLPLFTEHYRC